MLHITILTILLLIGFLAFQRRTILKYKELSIREKSFLATLTHDLKSPTRAQINMLNLLLKGNFGKLNPQQYEMIKLTCTSSKYMSNLVGNILTNYKYESHSVNLKMEYFDLIKIINEILNENKYSLCDKNFDVKILTPLNECIIFADELEIRRVIQNLLNNAITYGLKNTTIKIKLKKNSKFTIFSISNESNPISQKEIKHLFKKFSNTHNTKINKYSTGLGLYNAKNIIEQHDGKVYAKCTDNGKFTFGFRLKTATQDFAKSQTNLKGNN